MRTSGFAWLVVILQAEMSNEFLPAQVSQRVFELHELDEQVMFRVQSLGCLRAFEVKRQPLLDAPHSGALREVEKESKVEH